MQKKIEGNETPVVSIVIPCFNEERYIEICLASIYRLDYDFSKLEVIVVDNGSADNTVEIAKQFPLQILIKKDVKVGGVRNFGAYHAKGEYLVFLDADCVVESAWLNKGISQLISQANLVLGGQYLLRDDPSWLEKYWVLNSLKEQVYLTTLVGGCIFMRKNTFNAVGGFNVSLNSGEDSDLTHRLAAANFDVKIDPQLSVVHLGYPSEIIPFIKRQIWHSADYITNFKKSLSDKIFMLTLSFMLLLVLGVFQILCGLPYVYVTFIIALLLPIVLSYKRIVRSKTNLNRLVDIASIYLVDLLYLVGRSLGTIVSLRLLLLQSDKKINR
jgi:glycosyltransferase involved in cell wall biosynthesis